MISKKKLIYSVSIVLGLFFMLGILQISDASKYMSVDSNNIKTDKIKVIIDPGHGGVDGGAVAYDSTLEKDINLQIALVLNEMLRMSGAETIMTRDTDVSIHDISATTIRAKKVSDIHNRFRIIEENPDYVFVSIHQNTFRIRNIKVHSYSIHPTILKVLIWLAVYRIRFQEICRRIMIEKSKNVQRMCSLYITQNQQLFCVNADLCQIMKN